MSNVEPKFIEHSIRSIRGHRVMLDRDLAQLYGVETRVLVQAVKRNLRRFPEDFMFQLSKGEMQDWMSQIVISNPTAKMALRKRPYAFTEHGVAMLSSVLHSDQAINVNIAIMRAFTTLRQIVADNKEWVRKINDLENKYDKQFVAVFDAIRKIMHTPQSGDSRPIGFKRST